MKTLKLYPGKNIVPLLLSLIIFIPAVIIATGIASESADSGKGLIKLNDPLDEPEYYCVDIPGFRRNLQLNKALMAHTCKPGADDETYTINYPSEGQLYMEAYDRCVEAESAADGAELFMKPCSDSPLQRFVFTEEGRIILSNGDKGDLCLYVAPGEGTPTGGPSHVRRDLMLRKCSDAEPELSLWTLP
ncbi:ricin-type beta-trefoil lectin domain protein [Thermodesulfobacteriota bacterium]